MSTITFQLNDDEDLPMVRFIMKRLGIETAFTPTPPPLSNEDWRRRVFEIAGSLSDEAADELERIINESRETSRILDAQREVEL